MGSTRRAVEDSESSGCRHCGLPVPPAQRQAEGPRFCCFGCRFAHQLALPTADPTGGDVLPPSTLLLRLGLGIFLTLNIMVASWLSYSQELFGSGARASGADAVLPGLFSYLALFLCTLVVVMLGLPLLGGALGFARPKTGGGVLGRLAAGGVNAQTLIVLGVWAAYLLSAIHTFTGDGSLYYDTAAVVLVIVTLGSYLEAGAKRRASRAACRLLANLPAQVRVRGAAGIREVPAAEVRRGDHVQVRPGEVAAVDGEVVEGRARVDEASLTGESRPRAVAPGDRLLAGAVSLDGQLWLRTEQAGDDTVLALMERSLRDARAGRPPIQRLADRMAAVFVPLVVLVALAVLAWRWHSGQPGEGLLDALAVLLISCPCALGLAAPLASWHGLRRAAEQGILIDSATTLERAAKIDRLYFDKTGTLSRPQPALEKITVSESLDRHRALALAASLESASSHPIGRALLAAAAAHGLELPLPTSAMAVPGLGIEGRIEGRLLRLGSWRWLKLQGLDDDLLAQVPEQALGEGVFLFDDERLLARFDLTEELRPEAWQALASLRRLGLEVEIASGDRAAPTQRLARKLALAATSELLPEDKVEHLRRARRRGCTVAMVGDGINDAPVLAAADLGIAMGSASDLAQRSGNVRLIDDRLDRLPVLLQIARDTHRRIRANLLWAFGFNSVGVGLAATGHLTPVIAALAMLLSSLTVVRISSGAGRSAAAKGSWPATDEPRSERPPLTTGETAWGLDG